MIHLTLTNRSAEPIEVAVTEFTSLLGNFAVKPDKLALPPGATGEMEPMGARLSAELATVEVVLSLRSLGRSEQRTLVLRPAAAAEGGAAPTK